MKSDDLDISQSPTTFLLFLGIESIMADTIWLIRSGIFFVAGLIVLLFPKKVYSFQMFVGGKLRLKPIVEWEYEKKIYTYEGIALIIISIILFVYSI